MTAPEFVWNIIYFFTDLPCCRRFRNCILPAVAFCGFIYLIAIVLMAPGYREKSSSGKVAYSDTMENIKINKCQIECRPHESEALPKGIVSRTTDFELRPLWGIPKKRNESASINLFAVAVGIKQKDVVNKMVRKFLSSDFVVILFHYDGNVDKWKSLDWSDQAIHVSAMNQTKWWFAKRFLHPDIVSAYSYIFLWDEDLGVDNFHPTRYVSIIRNEGLEISQPALDGAKSIQIHHPITIRGRRSTVHRRIYKSGRRGKGCDESSKGPPCTGWIEMMAPVFSREAWRCVWYMIQNDLIHAWGLDMQLGYCSQGDRTKNVGVVDAEYIIHLGRPTLGGIADKETIPLVKVRTLSKNDKSTEISTPQHSHSLRQDHRLDVRRQSYHEQNMFKKRWEKAVEEDQCWVDPYPEL